MRLSELQPGENSLEEIRIWGIYHIENLVRVMENVMDKNCLVNEDLPADDKEQLRWVCYCMKDYISEVEEVFDRYILYVNDLEEKVKSLSDLSSGKG